jgi:hypothetical protein
LFTKARNERITIEQVEESVVKLKPQEIEIQNIDHLGIIAGMIDSILLVGAMCTSASSYQYYFLS